MCFSVRVEQNIRKLAREFGAEGSESALLDLFEPRTAGEGIKVSRTLERNFMEPASSIAEQVKTSIAAYTAGRATEWETEIFRQRQRLAVAEESLKAKETRKNQEGGTNRDKKIESLLARLSDLKRTDMQKDDDRIFPMVYATLIVEIGGRRQIWPMQYACRLAGKPAKYDLKFPGTYSVSIPVKWAGVGATLVAYCIG